MKPNDLYPTGKKTTGPDEVHPVDGVENSQGGKYLYGCTEPNHHFSHADELASIIPVKITQMPKISPQPRRSPKITTAASCDHKIPELLLAYMIAIRAFFINLCQMKAYNANAHSIKQMTTKSRHS